MENGEIVGRSTQGLKRNEFLVSQYSLSDFRFECEVKLVDNKGNSGIQLRSVPLPNGEMRGYQADIGAGWWGKLYEESGRALLENNDAEKFARKGEWNRYEIVAVGSRVRTSINGNLCVDRDDPAAARQGVIGLQLHSGGPTEVRFRNLRVTLLEPNPAKERAQPAGAVSELVVMAAGGTAPPAGGTAPAITFEKTTLDNVFRSEGVCIADFNNDGLRDIAGGSQIYFQSRDASGQVKWTTKIIHEKPQEFATNVYSQSFMNWAEDLNNDGRLDLIVVDFPGKQTWWFENPGNPEGPGPAPTKPSSDQSGNATRSPPSPTMKARSTSTSKAMAGGNCSSAMKRKPWDLPIPNRSPKPSGNCRQSPSPESPDRPVLTRPGPRRPQRRWTQGCLHHPGLVGTASRSGRVSLEVPRRSLRQGLLADVRLRLRRRWR